MDYLYLIDAEGALQAVVSFTDMRPYLMEEGLSRLSAAGSRAIPFAWGVNGFCSVAGASLAAVGALWLGLRGTLLAGSLLYLLAGALFRRLGEGGGGTPS